MHKYDTQLIFFNLIKQLFYSNVYKPQQPQAIDVVSCDTSTNEYVRTYICYTFQ